MNCESLPPHEDIVKQNMVQIYKILLRSPHLVAIFLDNRETLMGNCQRSKLGDDIARMILLSLIHNDVDRADTEENLNRLRLVGVQSSVSEILDVLKKLEKIMYAPLYLKANALLELGLAREGDDYDSMIDQLILNWLEGKETFPTIDRLITQMEMAYYFDEARLQWRQKN